MNMQSLKELIQKESKKITLLIIFFLVIIVTFFNCITAKKEANYTAQTTFYHIEQILNENQKDLNKQKNIDKPVLIMLKLLHIVFKKIQMLYIILMN